MARAIGLVAPAMFIAFACFFVCPLATAQEPANCVPSSPDPMPRILELRSWIPDRRSSEDCIVAPPPGDSDKDPAPEQPRSGDDEPAEDGGASDADAPASDPVFRICTPRGGPRSPQFYAMISEALELTRQEKFHAARKLLDDIEPFIGSEAEWLQVRLHRVFNGRVSGDRGSENRAIRDALAMDCGLDRQMKLEFYRRLSLPE